MGIIAVMVLAPLPTERRPLCQGYRAFSPEQAGNFCQYVLKAMNDRTWQNAPGALSQASEEQPGDEVRAPPQPGKLEPSAEVIDRVQGMNEPKQERRYD
jgi:hypothetical protein